MVSTLKKTGELLILNHPTVLPMRMSGTETASPMKARKAHYATGLQCEDVSSWFFYLVRRWLDSVSMRKQFLTQARMLDRTLIRTSRAHLNPPETVIPMIPWTGCFPSPG
jgi:hypothetical protein